MIGEICAYLKNYFTLEGDRHIGDWVIENGQITPVIDLPTAYIRIVGSRLNDGVWEVSKATLKDEAFHGGIWVMSPPADFIALVAEIEAWQAKNGGANSDAMSPFQSESFGGYSYSKGSTSADGGVSPTSWQSAYASRLSQYRKVRVI